MSDATTHEETTPTTDGKRPVWRGVLKWLAIVLLVVLALLIALRLLARTSLARNFVESRIEALEVSGLSFEIDGFSGDLLGDMAIDTLRIRDANGEAIVAEAVLLDWAPADLLSRRLTLKQIGAERITLTRRPVLVPGEEDTSSSGGGGPFQSYRLNSLRVDEIVISDEVIDGGAAFSLVANGRYGGADGNARLALKPVRGSEDSLIADLDWSRDTLFQGEVSLRADAGGVFTTLAGLPDDISLNANLTASGDVSQWQTAGTVQVNGTSAASLRGTRNAAGLEAELTLLPEPLSPLIPQLARLSEPVRLSLTADPAGEGAFPATVDIDSEVLEGRISAMIAGEGQPVPNTAEINLVLNAPQRLLDQAPFSLARLQLDGRAERTAQTAWRFEGTAAAQSLAYQDYRADQISGPLRLSLTDDGYAVTTTLDTEALDLPVAQVTEVFGTAPRLSLEGRYGVAAQRLELQSVTLEGAGSMLRADGTVAIDSLTVDLDTEISTARLAGPSADYVEGARGSLALTGPVGALKIIADLDVDAGPALPAPTTAYFSTPADLTAEVQLQPGGGVLVRSANLSGDGLRLTASGRYTSAGYDGTVALRLAQVADAGLGRTRLDATLSGQAGAFAADIDAEIADFAYSGIDGRNLTLSGRVTRRETGALAGNVDARADSLAGASFSLQAGVAQENAFRRIEDLNLAWGELTGQGSISVGPDLSSQLQGDLVVSGRPPVDGLPFDAIDATLRASDGVLDLDADLTDLALAGFSFTTATLTADGRPDMFDYSATLAGEGEVRSLIRPVSLGAEGRVTQAEEGMRVTALLDGALGPLEIRSPTPANLLFGAEGLSIDADLSVAGGALELRVTPEPAPDSNGRRVSISLDDMDLAPVFDLLARPELRGSASAGGELVLADGAVPQGDFRLDLKGFGVLGAERPDLEIGIESEFTDAALTADVKVDGVEGLDLDADVRLPVVAGGYEVSRLSLNAEGRGPLKTLWAFAGLPDTRLEGDFELTTRGEGGMSADSLIATLTVENAEFEHATLGLFLSDIDTRARYADGMIEIADFRATGRGDGTITASGQHNLGDTGRIEVRLDSLEALRRRGLSATLSGDIVYERRPEAGDITGDLTVDDANIDLAALAFTSTPPTLDVTFEDPDGEAVEEDTGRTDPTPTRLAISISAPRRLNVTGRGVDAELELSAEIAGILADPDIQASASVVRGGVALLGKQFEFTEGRVTFPGSVDDARINLLAERETDTFTAGISVTGALTDPDIRLTSTPDLPEDEILSRVLFGRSPSQLSALEAAQLAAALASLAGGGSGFDLTGNLSEALGLDRLDIGADASGQARLATGKYLAEDVYLEIETTGSGAPGVVVEWTPLDNVEVETEVDPVEGPKLSIDWKRDYD